MQKIIAFYHDKNNYMLKLDCTLPSLANICLHKSTDAKLYPFTEENKTYCIKIEKMSWVVHLSFLHAKQLLMKLLSKSLQTYANLLLGLMPANYTPTRCVNLCPPVFLRVGISSQKPVYSNLDKTTPVALIIWSCFIFNVKNLIVNWELHYRQTEEWVLQCWWVLFSLQYCVWSNGLLLPILSLSRAPPISHWRRYQTWQ